MQKKISRNGLRHSICKSEQCSSSERKHRMDAYSQGLFFLMASVRSAPLCPRHDPFNLALLSFQTSPPWKNRLSHLPESSSSVLVLPFQLSHHMLERAAAILPITERHAAHCAFLRLALGLRSSSGCSADNRRFDYLLVPTPANYSRRANAGTRFGSGPRRDYR